MTVYVDALGPSLPWGPCGLYRQSCHLFGTNWDELHSFAYRIECNRWWVQDERFAHYDLTQRMRDKAVRFGAVEVSRREMVAMARNGKIAIEPDAESKRLLQKALKGKE